MSFFTESNIPGIGKKITFNTHSKEKGVVIIHHDGKRELYIMDHDNEQQAGITLLDEEARRIGSILSGIVYKPKALQDLEDALTGMRLEWYAIEEDTDVIGKSLQELAIRQKTQISILAILKKDTTFVPNPTAKYILENGDICVVMGKAQHLKSFLNVISTKKDS